MGADSFIAFDGIRIGIDPPDEVVLDSRPARGRAAMPRKSAKL